MAQGIIQGTVSIAANSQVDDVLINEILAFNRQGASVVDWAVLAAATGIRISLYNGVTQLAPEFAPAIVAASQFPVYPDHFLTRFGLFASDRLLMKARNTTGAAIVIGWQFRFANVPGR
jgi:hypothetical protein